MSKDKSAMDVTIWDAMKESIKNMDAKSFPGMMMFLGLIVIESAANMLASLPDFGWIVSALVALLFGVFIGAWHIITERELNSVKQQSIAETSVKVIGGGSIALFVFNLIRLATGENIDWDSAWTSLFPTNITFGVWDILCILVVAFAFGWHLFSYIGWHDSDKRRSDRREHAEKMEDVNAKEKSATLAVRRAEVELMCIEAEENKVAELRERFKNLEPRQLNRVLTAARDEIRQAFEKKYNVDLDGDGSVGKPQQQPRVIQALASDTQQAQLKETKDENFTNRQNHK